MQLRSDLVFDARRSMLFIELNNVNYANSSKYPNTFTLDTFINEAVLDNFIIFLQSFNLVSTALQIDCNLAALKALYYDFTIKNRTEEIYRTLNKSTHFKIGCVSPQAPTKVHALSTIARSTNIKKHFLIELKNRFRDLWQPPRLRFSLWR